MIKQLAYLKKNRKGALIGAILSYILFFLMSGGHEFNAFALLLLPGMLLGGLIYRMFDFMHILNTGNGLMGLGYAVMFIVIANMVIFAFVGMYIQNKYFRR